jgi:hypothetical protein
MQTIATCNDIKLQRDKDKWFVLDGIHKREFPKNTAHFIFNDYLGQVVSDVEAEVNFNLAEGEL